MKRKTPSGLCILLLALAVALPALAYDYPLSSEAIREAYFLGKANGEKKAEFFAKYTQRLPMPKTGPYLAMIQLETPYAIVVERTEQAVSNYFAQDAEEDFRDKPAVFRLHVRINLTESYGWALPSEPGAVRLRPEVFWRDFTIRLLQDKEVPSRSVRGWPVFSVSGDGGLLAGAEMQLEDDATKIDSAPATVEVLTPDGQVVDTVFDLTKLR